MPFLSPKRFAILAGKQDAAYTRVQLYRRHGANHRKGAPGAGALKRNDTRAVDEHAAKR